MKLLKSMVPVVGSSSGDHYLAPRERGSADDFFLHLQFNNFNLIYAFINGGPPIPTATTQAGYTDIIISYVYNLAFASGRGVQYGYASAISLVLFMLIAVMSLLQFKFTNMWEEVGENV